MGIRAVFLAFLLHFVFSQVRSKAIPNKALKKGYLVEKNHTECKFQVLFERLKNKNGHKVIYSTDCEELTYKKKFEVTNFQNACKGISEKMFDVSFACVKKSSKSSSDFIKVNPEPAAPQ